jgi:hypothetical protein
MHTQLSEAYVFHINCLRNMHSTHPRFRERLLSGALGSVMALEHSEQQRDIDDLIMTCLLAVDAYQELADDVSAMKAECRKRMRGNEVVDINRAGRELAAFDEQLTLVLTQRDRVHELFRKLEEIIRRTQPSLPGMTVQGGQFVELSPRPA